MVSNGVMNKDHAIETLLFVNRAFKDDAGFLNETQSADAVTASRRRGQVG